MTPNAFKTRQIRQFGGHMFVHIFALYVGVGVAKRIPSNGHSPSPLFSPTSPAFDDNGNRRSTSMGALFLMVRGHQKLGRPRAASKGVSARVSLAAALLPQSYLNRHFLSCMTHLVAQSSATGVTVAAIPPCSAIRFRNLKVPRYHPPARRAPRLLRMRGKCDRGVRRKVRHLDLGGV